EEGLLLYYRFKPDIVLIDMMCEGLNGFDFYDEIYDNNTHKALIIATSNKVLFSEEDYLMSYGFDAYIPKPIDCSELESKIDEMIEDGKNG
ncbi:MAG: response regulator, partial [Bacillota bacterium]|nr:response regulator [Bacillota bacterium]